MSDYKNIMLEVLQELEPTTCQIKSELDFRPICEHPNLKYEIKKGYINWYIDINYIDD